MIIRELFINNNGEKMNFSNIDFLAFRVGTPRNNKQTFADELSIQIILHAL